VFVQTHLAALAFAIILNSIHCVSAPQAIAD
jgi:hypothetical protein